MAFQLRPIRPDEIPAAARLVASVFQKCVAPLYGREGIREFMSYASPEAFAQRLRADHVGFVVVDEPAAILGVVEIRANRHISLLFVEAESQRRGIGRRLVAAAIEACKAARPDLTTVSVHASPNSVKAYERFGFVATEPEQEKKGIRFVPMVLSVGSRGGA